MPRTCRRAAASAVAALLLATVLPIVAAPTSSAQTPAPTGDTTRLIVLFKQGVSIAVQDSVSDAEGDIVRDLSFIRARVIEIPTVAERLIRKRLSRRSDVLAVEADLPVHATLAPTEVAYDNNPIAEDILNSVAVPAAWDRTTGSSSTVVAVLDTGVRPMSSDLASGRFVTGYNAQTGRTGSVYTNDDNGHGTYVASVAAAVGNNGSGMAGVCWSCKIMPVKVLNSSGSGTTSEVASGINWAVSRGAKILSLSLSGGGTTTLKAAIDNALSKGATVIAAAGNAGQHTATPPSNAYPAGYSNVISVGGVTSHPDPNFATGTNQGDWVTIAAPWTNLALSRSYALSWFSGTSSATPMVSGIVSLLLAVKGTLTPTEIRSIIMRTATDPDLDINDTSGLINARSALDDVLGGSSGTTSSTSSTTSSSTTSSSTTSSSTTTTTTTAPPTGGTTTTVTGSGYGSTSRTLTVKTGSVAFSSCSSCTLGIYDSDGQPVGGTATGSITIASLPAGTYTFQSTAGTWWSRISYTITYQA